MKIELDKRFTKRAKGRYGKYIFEVGVLKDKRHKEPDYTLYVGRDSLGRKRKLRKYKYGSYAGGPIRKPGYKSYDTKTSEISEKFSKLHKIYVKPFQRKSSDIMKFTKTFFDVVKGKYQSKRLVNLLQAIVRNPILKNIYGKNSPITKKQKGFDRYMIDTAQFFKSITAKVSVRRV